MRFSPAWIGRYHLEIKIVGSNPANATKKSGPSTSLLYIKL